MTVKKPLLFVQGAGAMSAPDGSGVLARYLESSLGADFAVNAPEMPDAATDPEYPAWRDLIDRQLHRLHVPVLLVGHSFGGSVLLKYLAECSPPVPVAGLFLVSVPWWGLEGWAYEDYAPPADFGSRLPEMPLFLYHSRHDPHVPFEPLAYYEAALPSGTSRLIDGSEHSFANGLPEMVSDIQSSARDLSPAAP